MLVCMDADDTNALSLLSIHATDGLKFNKLRPLTLIEAKVIEDMAEPNRTLQSVADVIRMFKQAMAAWYEGLRDVAEASSGGVDHIAELNLKTINVLSAFFVLDCYTSRTLVSLRRANLISDVNAKAWDDAPEKIKEAIKLAKSVRGALHQTLPIKSYKRSSDKDRVTLTVELCAHSGRGSYDRSVCALTFMSEVNALLVYAISMWRDLVPIVLARLDETCKSLAKEVEQAGGGRMTVGRANVSQDGRLNLEYLQVSDCPVAELLGRFGE
jgi:hypothetical protein